jgi:quercetin dioxygenase-like cupin family protein
MTILDGMQTRNLIVDRPSDEGIAMTSWGEMGRIRLASETATGSLVVMDYRAPAGFGPPRHIHRNDDEIFLVQRGRIALWSPLQCGTALPGDLVMLPKGIAHTWRSSGDEDVQLQVITSPGEFKTFFSEIVRRGLTASDIQDLTAVADSAGMDIVGPPLTADEADAIFRGERIA